VQILPRTRHGVKDDHRCVGGRIYHRAYTDRSFHSIQEGRGQLHMGVIWTLNFGSTHGERQRSLASGEGRHT
jgi:hypothetical protein